MSNQSTIFPPSPQSPSTPPLSHHPEAGDPLLSDKERLLAVDILLYLRYIAVILAIPLTVINIVIFLQRHMRNATAVYVIGLSVAQLYYVTMMSIFSIIETSLTNPYNDYGFAIYNLYFCVYVGIVAKRGSYAVMCLVSVERLYAIVRPLHVKTFLLSRRPLTCVLAAYFLTGLLHVYIPARTVVTQTPVGERTVLRFVRTELYLRHKEVNDFFSVAAKVILTYLALLVQILLNVLTACCLRRHNITITTTLQSSSSSSSTDDVKRAQERQLTVTILAATVCYVALSLPAALHNLIYSVMPGTYGAAGRHNNVYVVVEKVSVVLTVGSSAVDFFCFLALSTNFRKTLFGLFGIQTKGRSSLSAVKSGTAVDK